jgi:hypothetical protein
VLVAAGALAGRRRADSAGGFEAADLGAGLALAPAPLRSAVERCRHGLGIVLLGAGMLLAG